MNSDELIPKLVRACLDNDRRLVEEISTMLVKVFKKSAPDIAREISQSLTYARNGASTIRSMDVQPLPIDRESRFTLCKAEEPLEIEEPILMEDTFLELQNFIYERSKIEKLILEDITPPNSLLFVGDPGVGKTYSAKWLSYKLDLPLITMDLATSISSYLGRSGQNIKSIFDYARSFPAILLLDEIDSIAKKRDDSSDLGELKRLVNVLLKELETWPSQSVVIAATNHPDLLDKAIWRRFDRTVDFKLPGIQERQALLERYLGKYYRLLSPAAISFAIKQTDSINAADICKLCMHAKRKIVLEDSNPDLVIFEEFCSGHFYSRNSKIEICKLLKEVNPAFSVRDISRITKISITSVSRYLQNGGNVNE
ncbi:AAA family ATPase [Scatolibacter rhodanostii]|uniref:AAA family ATPase n=1 Tax=Scatolibacter rhodanostii TaxID=2014781 RepID=UPI00190ED1BC|nr:ATP-binding protein [Scatolibacter rhodanostii]